MDRTKPNFIQCTCKFVVLDVTYLALFRNKSCSKKVKVTKVNLYSALLCPISAFRYDPRVTSGSHTCHRYEPYLPLLLSHEASRAPFGWYSLCRPTPRRVMRGGGKLWLLLQLTRCRPSWIWPEVDFQNSPVSGSHSARDCQILRQSVNVRLSYWWLSNFFVGFSGPKYGLISSEGREPNVIKFGEDIAQSSNHITQRWVWFSDRGRISHLHPPL